MIQDMPKIECPFIRETDAKGEYVVVDKINPGYEWVFTDPDVIAVEKLHGTNVSIVINDGQITAIFNRTARIPFFNKGASFIVDGVLAAFRRGYTDMLEDGQHFGELIGHRVNGNPYKIDGNLWVPFQRLKTICYYKSFGKYPKNYASFSEWFKTLMPLYGLQLGQGQDAFVEGVVFYHPDGRMAKLRKDMWPWFTGQRHKEQQETENDGQAP